MTDRFVELKDAKNAFAELVERAAQGANVVITRDGQPVARLGPPGAAPDHRAKETRHGITLAPEFEPGEARLARIAREGDVPHRLRKVPKH